MAFRKDVFLRGISADSLQSTASNICRVYCHARKNQFVCCHVTRANLRIMNGHSRAERKPSYMEAVHNSTKEEPLKLKSLKRTSSSSDCEAAVKANSVCGE